MSRRVARDYAFRMIFSYMFKKEVDTDGIEEIIRVENLAENDAQYLRDVVNAVAQHYDELGQLIAANAKNFRIDRIFKPDLAALYLACAEMCYMPDIPKSVSICEAVEMVKVYSTEQSSGFVNGVLAGVFKQLEKGEA